MTSLSLDQEVLLSGKDSLFSLVVSKLTRAKVSWSSSLSKEDSSLSSSMGIESWSGQLLDGSFSSSMSLSSREDSSWGEVGPQELLLGSNDLLGSRNIRNLQEAGDSITVWVVGAGHRGKASWELWGGSSQGNTGQTDDKSQHLDC